MSNRDDNALSGISIPSIKDIAEKVVECMPVAIVNLGNPLQRRQLKDVLERALGHVLTFELERAVETATNKAVTHVFRIMRDSEYQDKRQKRREWTAQQRQKRQEKKAEATRVARMDYSKQRLEDITPKKEILQ